MLAIALAIAIDSATDLLWDYGEESAVIRCVESHGAGDSPELLACLDAAVLLLELEQ